MTAPFTETGAIGMFGGLLAAPLIGFAFGWCLERAGLGHAPKLIGQFYGTDFTVFKVMFTALLTAMLGAFWLNHVGWLDLDLVYLPETFVAPQAVGGAIFGVGFLIGGLCPGTSCVAAASGARDGLAVVAGILLGIAVFNAGFVWIAPFYQSTPLGSVTLADILGVKRGAVVALITCIALGGFAVASKLEGIRS